MARVVKFAQQGGTKVHVLNDTTGRGRCGAELWGPEYLARLVPADDRCMAAACRTQWPALLRLVG